MVEWLNILGFLTHPRETQGNIQPQIRFRLFLTVSSDGLYAQDGNAGLKVTAGTGLNVKVAPGYAFIRVPIKRCNY